MRWMFWKLSQLLKTKSYRRSFTNNYRWIIQKLYKNINCVRWLIHRCIISLKSICHFRECHRMMTILYALYTHVSKMTSKNTSELFVSIYTSEPQKTIYNFLFFFLLKRILFSLIRIHCDKSCIASSLHFNLSISYLYGDTAALCTKLHNIRYCTKQFLPPQLRVSRHLRLCLLHVVIISLKCFEATLQSKYKLYYYHKNIFEVRTFPERVCVRALWRLRSEGDDRNPKLAESFRKSQRTASSPPPVLRLS